jgi:plasmid stabilization system protein ParE
VNPRRVRFTATAHEHIKAEKAWWLDNRIHAEIFAAEFEEAVRVVALLPGAGTAYPHDDVPGLRRIYLRKVACHIYYTFDDMDVIIRAAWGARRGRGPSIEP